MAEPWSIVADHPIDREPFGLVFADDSTFAEAEHIARHLLASFNLLGTFLPTSPDFPTAGHYLLTYRVAPETLPRLTTIWARDLDDAMLRLNILAADGILFMPSPG
ncbi:MAG: hypothetical protein ACO3PY_06865 [Pontimonas sp.]